MPPVLGAFVSAAANIIGFGGLLYALARPLQGDTVKVWLVPIVPGVFNVLILTFEDALSTEQRIAGLFATLLLAANYITLVVRGSFPDRRSSTATSAH